MTSMTRKRERQLKEGDICVYSPVVSLRYFAVKQNKSN